MDMTFHIHIRAQFRFPVLHFKDILTSNDLIPMSLLAPRLVDAMPMHKILRVLFDNGGSLSLIHERVMPQGISLSNETSQLIHTIAGTYSSHASGILHDPTLHRKLWNKFLVI